MLRRMPPEGINPFDLEGLDHASRPAFPLFKNFKITVSLLEAWQQS
jgi:hypothetical protein